MGIVFLILILIFVQVPSVYGATATDGQNSMKSLSQDQMQDLAKQKNALIAKHKAQLEEQAKLKSEKQKTVETDADNSELQINTIRTSSDADIVPGKLIIKYKKTASDTSIKSLNEKISSLSEKKNKVLGYSEIRLAKTTNIKKLVKELKKDPDVEYAEPVYKRSVLAVNSDFYNEPFYSKGWQWGLEAVSAGAIWAGVDETTFSNTAIAILDTGVDTDCSEFSGTLLDGYDFANDDNDPDDDYGHGTHVAGIVAALYDGHGMAGVAGGAKIMPVKVLDENGSGDTVSCVNGILYAVNHGAKVINMSFGSYGYSEAEKEAIDYAYAHGVTLVAAAGNEELDYASYPAAYDHVIGVGSLDCTGSQYTISDFSNYGTDVDVYAPGEDILSTVPVELDKFSAFGDGTADGYTLKSGTSMASPFVAGMAALILANNSSLNCDAVLTQLQTNGYSFTQHSIDCKAVTGAPGAFRFPKLRLGILNGQTANQREIALAASDYRYSNFLASVATIANQTFDVYRIKVEPVYNDNDQLTNQVVPAENAIPVYVDSITIQSTTMGSITTTLPDSGSYAFYAVGANENNNYIESNACVTLYDTDSDGNTSTTSAVSLNIGQSADASIGTYGDEDYYKFTVTDPGYYMIETFGLTDTYGYLYDENGVLLNDPAADNDNPYYSGDCNFNIVENLTTPGAYYVKAAGNQDQLNNQYTGDYSIKVSKKVLISGTVSLPNGQSDADLDLFFINRTGSSPEEYDYEYVDYIEEEIATGSIDYCYYADDGKDYFVEYDLASSDIFAPLGYYSFSGTVLSINQADTASGATVNLTPILISNTPDNNTSVSASSISLGHTADGNINYSEDDDYYQFSVPSSGDYTLNLSADDYYTDAYILNGQGDEISLLRDDYSENTSTESVTFHADSGTTYYAVIENDNDVLFNASSYSLSLVTAAAINDQVGNTTASALEISLPITTTALIDYYGDLDFYKFNAPQAGYYSILLTPADDELFFPELYLYEGGQWVEYQQGDIERYLSAGIHYIKVGGINSYGHYTLVAKMSSPTATNVRITGTARVGSTLTGAYTYSDAENDPESGTTYRWLRSDTQSGTYTAISGATARTYQLTSDDLSKYIKFEVTPMSSNEPATGSAIQSSPVGPIQAASTTTDDSGGGGGGGGGSIDTTETSTAGTTTETTAAGNASVVTGTDGKTAVTVEVNTTNLQNMLTSAGTTPITIDAATQAKQDSLQVNIPSNIFTTAETSQKPVVVESNNVSFTIDPGTFNITNPNSEVKLGVTQLSLDALPQGLQTAAQNRDDVSLVFDFSLSVGNDKITQFDKPMTITVAFDSSKVTDPTKLGVYYFNEKDNKWEYVGGKVNADNTITFTVEHFSKYTVMEYKNAFKDITNHWAKADIDLMASKGIVGGVSETAFSPDTQITRADFAVLLARALDLKASAGSKVFKDVPADAYYQEAISNAYAAGILSGVSENAFDPKTSITREEMATMIMKAYAYKSGKSLDSIVTTMEIRFNDDKDASIWAKRNITLADATGLMKGKAAGMFVPKGKTTRAEAVVVLKRLMDKLGLLVQ